MAIALRPAVLIADEPSTALDVITQQALLRLLRQLVAEENIGLILISHDLGVIAGIADRVIVMYGGQIVEQAPVRELFGNPQHPYTRALLRTIPSVRGERAARLEVIEGQPPILGAPPAACPFRFRCPERLARCDRENPVRVPVGTGHDAACFWDPATGGERNA